MKTEKQVIIKVLDYVKFMNLEDISDMSKEMKRVNGVANHFAYSAKLVEYIYDNKIRYEIIEK
jgi:hypothetical protein